MSRLRAKCPDCRTYTAVAIGPDYECHACGRGFGAGLVRVPRAWGEGGEPMVEAASLPLAYPEAGVVEKDSLGEQTLALASDLPERPLVLGGCCCSHVGAIEALAARHGRISVVWLDAHGDLNTPDSSPSGNEWGMPLRMAIDSVAVDVDVFAEEEVASFMPEPGGLGVDEVEALFRDVRGRTTVLGAGLTGLRPDPRNLLPLERLTAALGL